MHLCPLDTQVLRINRQIQPSDFQFDFTAATETPPMRASREQALALIATQFRSVFLYGIQDISASSLAAKAFIQLINLSKAHQSEVDAFRANCVPSCSVLLLGSSGGFLTKFIVLRCLEMFFCTNGSCSLEPKKRRFCASSDCL